MHRKEPELLVVGRGQRRGDRIGRAGLLDGDQITMGGSYHSTNSIETTGFSNLISQSHDKV